MAEHHLGYGAQRLEGLADRGGDRTELAEYAQSRVGSLRMAKPEVDIQVDESTGRWSVDSLPMILVPQHFFLNNHYAVEKALGAAELEKILRPAGYRSAYVWCQKE